MTSDPNRYRIDSRAGTRALIAIPLLLILLASGCSATQTTEGASVRPAARTVDEPPTRPFGAEADFAAHVWSVFGRARSGNFVIAPPALALGLGALHDLLVLPLTPELGRMLLDERSNASIRAARSRSRWTELELTAELSYDPRCFDLAGGRAENARRRRGVRVTRQSASPRRPRWPGTDDAVPADADVVVLTTLAFSALWAFPFPRTDTVERTFRAPEGEDVLVPMMSGERHGRLGELPDVRLVEMPLRNEYGVLFVLPREAIPLSDIEQGLTPHSIEEWFGALGSETLVRIDIPRFAVRNRVNMAPHLAQLGVPRDSVPTSCGRPAEVRHFIQTTAVEVDESGVRMSSRVAVEVVVRGDVTHVRLNRPFLFIVHDHGKILLIGRIVNPR